MAEHNKERRERAVAAAQQHGKKRQVQTAASRLRAFSTQEDRSGRLPISAEVLGAARLAQDRWSRSIPSAPRDSSSSSRWSLLLPIPSLLGSSFTAR